MPGNKDILATKIVIHVTWAMQGGPLSPSAALLFIVDVVAAPLDGLTLKVRLLVVEPGIGIVLLNGQDFAHQHGVDHLAVPDVVL
jgi:hypothetical protein